MDQHGRYIPPLPGQAGTVDAYIGLGSNMGDSRAVLAKAREGIASLPGVLATTASSLYETEPQGDADQPFFVNQALRAECAASVRPESFLRQLLDLESALGRERPPGRRFGPRLIDLDLLLFGNTRMNTGALALPHPRMLERAFVLVPLAEIAPNLMLPQGVVVEDALALIHYSRLGNRIFQSNGASANA